MGESDKINAVALEASVHPNSMYYHYLKKERGEKVDDFEPICVNQYMPY